MDEKKEAYEAWKRSESVTDDFGEFDIFCAGWDAKPNETTMKIMVESERDIIVERVNNNIIYLKEVIRDVEEKTKTEKETNNS